jgi:3-deoxy-manno-octulosonate cytidylyltransferase (CMP-KDO synthetase)
MKIIAVIPARYASSRFPGKPLALIHGRPMIWWVWNALSKMDITTYVATDDERISKAVLGFGGQVIMTGDCVSGTDRVAQACKQLDFDVVLNIQGDEPMIRPEHVQGLMSAFTDGAVNMATLCMETNDEREINNPNIAKVITNVNSDAIYFSRSVIPFCKDAAVYYKHIGIYAYKRDFLYTFTSLPQGVLEKAESLEQLRAIENGYPIRVVKTVYRSIGVDLPEHIAPVESEMQHEL